MAPFDNRHRLLEGCVEVEGVELGEAAQAIGIDVHQGWAVDHGRVDARDDEGRRRDRSPHPETGPDAGDQPGATTAETTEVYGVGALLLAGSEVYRLAPR